MNRTILTVLAALQFAGAAFSANSTWSSAVDGAWDDPTNWSTNPFFPNNGNGAASYDAFIDVTGSDYAVTLVTDVTLQSLTLDSANATLRHLGGILSVGTATLTSGTFRLDGGTIQGGTFDVGAGANFTVTNNANNRFDGVTVDGTLSLAAFNARVTLENGADLRGTVNMSGTFAPRIIFNQTGTISGPLTINMDSDNIYAGTDFLTVEGDHTLTLGSGVTVRGMGAIGTTQFVAGGSSALINQGTISADVGNRTLSIGSASTGFSNEGTLNVLNGATVQINAPNWSNTGTINVLDNSTLNLVTDTSVAALGTVNNPSGTVYLRAGFDNEGGSHALSPAQGSYIFDGARVFGGGTVTVNPGRPLLLTNNANNRFDGVTVDGTLSLAAFNARVTLENGADLRGTVNMSGTFAPRIIFNQTGTISGPLTINMDSDNIYAGTDFLTVEGDHTLTLGSGVTVRGMGAIGTTQFVAGGSSALVNQGTISADVGNRTLYIGNCASTTFTNRGTLEAVNGANLVIAGAFSQQAGVVRMGVTSVLDVQCGMVISGGAFEVIAPPGYAFSNNQQFPIIHGGPINGSFSSLSFPSLESVDVGAFWDTSALYGSGKITVISGTESYSSGGHVVSDPILTGRLFFDDGGNVDFNGGDTGAGALDFGGSSVVHSTSVIKCFRLIRSGNHGFVQLPAIEFASTDNTTVPHVFVGPASFISFQSLASVGQGSSIIFHGGGTAILNGPSPGIPHIQLGSDEEDAGILCIRSNLSLGTDRFDFVRGALHALSQMRGANAIGNDVRLGPALDSEGLVFTGLDMELAGNLTLYAPPGGPVAHVLTFDNTTRFLTALGAMEGGGSSSGVSIKGNGTLILQAPMNAVSAPMMVEGAGLIVNGTLAPTSLSIARNGLLGGSGEIQSDVTIGEGVLSPGNSPGLLTIDGDLFGSALTLFEFELGADVLTYDVLQVSGTIHLAGGEFRLTNADNVPLQEGDLLRVFTGLGDSDPVITGTFAAFDLPPLDSGLEWDTSNLYNHGQLSVVPQNVPEPGALSLGVLGCAVVFGIRRGSSGSRQRYHLGA